MHLYALGVSALLFSTSKCSTKCVMVYVPVALAVLFALAFLGSFWEAGTLPHMALSISWGFIVSFLGLSKLATYAFLFSLLTALVFFGC